MQTIKQTIAPAGVVRYSITADFFRLMETGGPVSVVYFRHGQEVARADEVEAGYAEKFDDAPFTSVEVSSATGQEFKFVFRLGGSVRYDRMTIAAAGGVTHSAPVVGVAAADVLPANSARRYLLIQNNHASLDAFVSFGVDATVAGGVKLPPGAVFELATFTPSGRVSMIAAVENSAVVVVEG